MIVTADCIEGTIGGGALELDVIASARAMLRLAGDMGVLAETAQRLSAILTNAADNSGKTPDNACGVSGVTDAVTLWRRKIRDYPLGPSLGQCCGGSVKMLFELFTPAEAAQLAQIAGQTEQEGLVARSVDSGRPIRVLVHRKDGYGDLPLRILRVTRDMLSGARARSACFIPGARGLPAWFIEPLSRARTPLYLYGAGHVGRALVRVLEGLPFEVTWVDTSEDRFPAATELGSAIPHPSPLPGGEGTPSQWSRGNSLSLRESARVRGGDLKMIATPDPAAVAMGAPDSAVHLVMTYSHPLDLAICHAALKRGNYRFLGLIGSKTKRARFVKRLRELGHAQHALDSLSCPIGIQGLLGKEPAVIAVSVAARLLQVAVSDAKAVRASGDAAQ